MAALEIAVLSYHGWEIDPAQLAEDVAGLRTAGWSDLSLAGLRKVLDGGAGSTGRCFHVTIDDGAEGDRECIAVLKQLSCPASLFLPLEVMSEAARAVHREWVGVEGLALEDHSLRHARTFHYRHVIGFYSEAHPFVSSPERLGLRVGDPVCSYGGELAHPTFLPDEQVAACCRQAAEGLTEAAGTPSWQRALTDALIGSRLGFWRWGRLCIAGHYEARRDFRARLSRYLEEGRERLQAFLGRAPMAFAHPWWERNFEADRQLRALGYRMTFGGRGLCRHRSPWQIPRLFVNRATPRPLDPGWLASQGADRSAPFGARLASLGRRAVFA